MKTNKTTMFIIALICFIAFPYAYRSEILQFCISKLEEFGVSRELILVGMNGLFYAIRGIGYATLVYCVSQKGILMAFFIAIIADIMIVVQNYQYVFDTFGKLIENFNKGFFKEHEYLFGLLLFPFALVLVLAILGLFVRVKQRIIILGILASILYVGMMTYLDKELYLDWMGMVMVIFVIFGGFAIDQIFGES